MKIATFNVNGINGRLARLLEWLAEARPDVACLQELKAPPDAFPEAALREAGYASAWVGQRAYNGVALLVRGADPVVSRRALPADASDTQARYIEAAVNGVLVACLYAPNGNPRPGPRFDYKLAWMRRLLDHARSLLDSGHPVAIAGDFNVVPSDEVHDIYSPRSWLDDALLQPEPRALYAELLHQGWIDSLRQHDPAAVRYTYWDYKRNRWPRDAGLRIDHLLLSPSLAARLKDAGVDKSERGKEGASDHAPAWIRLKAR